MGAVSDPILVLGASGGIGGAIAAGLAAEGHRIILHGRDQQRLAALATKLGGNCFTETADLNSESEVTSLFRRIKDTHGCLGGLVFSVAAPFSNKLAHRTPWSVFEQQFSTQLKALHLCASAAFPLLANAAETRRVVLISSEYALAAPPIKTAPYASAKAAMTAYGRVIAKEWLKSRIRVHILAPGMVKTPLIADLPDQFLDQVASAMPEGQLTTAADVAGMVKFLMTAAADTLYGMPLRVSRGDRT